MKVSINNEIFKVRWTYENRAFNEYLDAMHLRDEYLEAKRGKKEGKLLQFFLKVFGENIEGDIMPDITYCIITDKKGNELKESVVKYKYDVFNKRKAREFSLTKVLKTWFTNPSDRKVFWDEYNKSKSLVQVNKLRKILSKLEPEKREILLKHFSHDYVK